MVSLKIGKKIRGGVGEKMKVKVWEGLGVLLKDEVGGVGGEVGMGEEVIRGDGLGGIVEGGWGEVGGEG